MIGRTNSDIVGGIGTAFSTTCTALSASISTMIIRFLVERIDEETVVSINAIAEDNLLHRFTSTNQSLRPFMEVVSESQHLTLSVIGEYENRVAQEWSNRVTLVNDQIAKTDWQEKNNSKRYWIDWSNSKQHRLAT